MSTLLLLALTALAQDATGVDPPLPIVGVPWSASVSAYALPPQRVSWITDDAPLRSCLVLVDLSPDASFVVSPGACAPGMAEETMAAARAWRFQVPEGAEGVSRLELRFVLQYSATLGATTLHAEVDPGAAHLDLGGVPGLKLVHPATLVEPLTAKLPKPARKAGLGPSACAVRARVDVRGRVAEASATDCPETLRPDALKRVGKARFTPRTVDGLSYSDEVTVRVEYTP